MNVFDGKRNTHPPLSPIEQQWKEKFCVVAEEFISRNGFAECLNVPYITDLIGLDGGILSKDLSLTYILWVELLQILRKYLGEHQYKYKTFNEFLEAYSGEFDNETESEKIKLWHIANWMNIIFKMVNPRKNKGLAMEVVPKFVEGWHVKYITGSGQTKATRHRVSIFEREGNVKPVSRKPSVTRRRSMTSDDQVQYFSNNDTNHHTHGTKRSLDGNLNEVVDSCSDLNSPESVPTVIPILPHVRLNSSSSQIEPGPSSDMNALQLSKYPDYRPKRVKREKDVTKQADSQCGDVDSMNTLRIQRSDERLREFSEIALSLRDGSGDLRQKGSSMSSSSSNTVDEVNSTFNGDVRFDVRDPLYADAMRQMFRLYLEQVTAQAGSEEEMREILQRMRRSLAENSPNNRRSNNHKNN